MFWKEKISKKLHEIRVLQISNMGLNFLMGNLLKGIDNCLGVVRSVVLGTVSPLDNSFASIRFWSIGISKIYNIKELWNHKLLYLSFHCNFTPFCFLINCVLLLVCKQIEIPYLLTIMLSILLNIYLDGYHLVIYGIEQNIQPILDPFPQKKPIIYV